MSSPATLVLDTNAWLDLLVFHDPSMSGLADAVGGGVVRIATDARALTELARVLRYGTLKLDESRAIAHLAVAKSLACVIDVAPLQLPHCPDPDDQMFLEIAVTAHALALITRDAALLGMSRRMARDYGFRIVQPARWREGIECIQR